MTVVTNVGASGNSLAIDVRACYFHPMLTHGFGLHFILYWVVSGVAVLLTAHLVRGFEVRGFFAALLAAAVIGFLNALLWPVLFFLTIPLNIVTLGLFTFVLNGFILKLSAALLPGFEIKSWLSAIFGSIVLSLVGLVLHWAFI